MHLFALPFQERSRSGWELRLLSWIGGKRVSAGAAWKSCCAVLPWDRAAVHAPYGAEQLPVQLPRDRAWKGVHSQGVTESHLSKHCHLLDLFAPQADSGMAPFLLPSLAAVVGCWVLSGVM